MGALGRHGRLGRQLEFEPIFLLLLRLVYFILLRMRVVSAVMVGAQWLLQLRFCPFFFLFPFWCLGVIEIELCTVVGDRVECMMASMNGIYGELGGKFGNLIIVEIVNLY